MPDYTSILRRSISALPDSSPAMREAVYQRARAALARQLTAVDPPLSARDIEAQQQQLEDAVASIEAELAPAEEDDFFFDEPEVEPAPEPVPPPPPPAKTASAPPLVAARVPPPAAMPAAPNFEPLRRDDRVQPKPESVYEDEVEQIPDFLAEAESHPPAGRFNGGVRRDDYDDGDEAYDDEGDAEAQPSRLPALIAIAIVLLVVLGGATLLYSQRETLAGLVGFGGGAEPEIALTDSPGETDNAADSAPAGDPVADVADPNKRPDRLTNGVGQADSVEPEPPAPVAPPEPVEPPAAVAQVPAPAEPPAVVPPPGEPQAGQSLVAQRAIFYEQGSDGSPGQATDGTVAWSQITAQNGSQAVQANVELGEREFRAIVTISRNVDESLPASHLVEIQLVGTSGLGTVERVPALVLKPNEQARGQPLAGAAVPVTEDLFWIALSDDQEQVTRNLALLREGSWFDLPVLFAGGKKALLTFEKGIPGDKVFETVLNSWSEG